MLVFIAILLSMSQVLVKCELKFVDPDIPKYPESVESVSYMLGSMTPYHVPKTCTESKALLVMRHGSKFPKQTVMDKFEKLNDFQNKLKNLYSNNNDAFKALSADSQFVIENIIKWENKMTSDKAKAANDKGILTTQQLAKRWNAKLINMVLDIKSEDIEFISAPENRCVVSGEKFLSMFLTVKGQLVVDKVPEIKNKDIEDNRIKLAKGPKVLKTEKEIEDIYYETMCPEKECDLKTRIRNLLFPDGSPNFEVLRDEITSDMVKTMYLACANSFGYDYTDDARGHAWCTLFNYEDLKMFEDMHDIQYYYKNGYYNNKSKYFGLPMMKEILDFLNNTTTKKFKIFSAHTSNCLSLITGFRLYQDDEKLTIENMTKHNMINRKWRSSFIASYACNIMVVVYNCQHTEIAENKESQEVSIYLNEKPITVIFKEKETCTQCPIEDVKNLIGKLLDDANNELKLVSDENAEVEDTPDKSSS
ncbi:multiple inositol polyphosphate phosphatase 1-like [Rhopalosiphum maidis]|uniref:multiple inositol polyphosphate phosphatase 1-like n=1 Tax=Rhopalosiphum maidis TaxID=43146 RepID=UPI000EFED03A|nr:multiple inositol polyphosphate phosphatase 1-like [Rhopalosiphum maidis]XP_026804502.1 multiple inositol polyphosphate phosphatase 1-like [Rhopalosiphum maidis]